MTRVDQRQTTILLVDPPWPHANGSRTNSGKSPKYALMSIEQISDLRQAVRHLAGENAIIYLWSTGPHLPAAIGVLNCWGFSYRSFHVWAKSRIACGFWARSNAEMLLVGEAGRPAAPDAGLLANTIIIGEPADRRHSSKPATVYEMIERLWPAARKIELFARSERAGWGSFGDEIGSVITSLGIEVRA